MEPESDGALPERLRCLLEHDSGRKASDCCVLIPSGRSEEMLEKHLSILANQDSLDFDVLVIGIPPKAKARGFNLLVYREKFPLGSSGAFGIGQVLAYCLGYECIVNADIDCFPVSRDLLGQLRAAAKKTGKAVFPASVFDSNDPKANRNYIVNHYGFVPREIYRRFGFANFRFFKGGEDAELQGRLEMEGAVARCDSALVEHRNLESNHFDAMLLPGNKYIFYSKNFIIAHILLCGYAVRRGKAAGAARHFAVTIYSLLLYWLIYNNYPDFLVPIFRDGLMLKTDGYYARSTHLHEIPDSGTQLRLSVEGEEAGGIQFRPKSWLIRGNRAVGACYLASMCGKIALTRADCLAPSEKFLNDYKFFIQYLMLLRPMKYRDGKVYSEKSGVWRLALNMALFAFALPFLALAALLGVARAALQKDFPVSERNLGRNIAAFLTYISNVRR